jgi:hypothetical protein
MYLLNAVVMQWCDIMILLRFLNCVGGVFIEGYIRASLAPRSHDPLIPRGGLCDGYFIPTIPHEGEWGYSWRQAR